MARALLFLLVFSACTERAELQVYAAASLTDALREIGHAYEAETGTLVTFNFAGSNVLARQIESGAPADLFLSADERSMDRVHAAERVSVLSNTLVLVGAKSPRELIGKKVALGDPASVPAGVYARDYLTRIGLWDAIAPNVIPTENVRAALAAVKAGNADAAIVYRTDSTGVALPYDGISYPFALVKSSAEGRRFFAYLQSKPALEVFRKYGFVVK